MYPDFNVLPICHYDLLTIKGTGYNLDFLTYFTYSRLRGFARVQWNRNLSR